MTLAATPLRDRVALITGGGSGIGAATARHLAAAGTAVAILGRRPAQLSEVGAAIRASGGRCLEIPGDVRDYAQLETAVDRTVATFGRLDILVANAARVDHDPIDTADPALWRDVIETNVLGVMYAVRACLPRLLAGDGGDVVIVASTSGRMTYVGEPVYVASKHATVAFADCLRKEVSGRGVRVIVLEPGLVDTPFIDWAAVGDRVSGVIPLQPDDCAEAIRFALEQPARFGLNEIVIRSSTQGS
jgi:NADP-dependent 3-hydroxy acid dehydrogenase YdfG